MKVLVVGATGGSGRAAVKSLLAGGHTVTAFARRADTLAPMGAGLRCVNGDVLEPADIERAVDGQDAVIVTLGISESALRVRLAGSAGTAMNVRSAGTRNTIAAMRKCGVRKLVVQTSYGVGETRNRLTLMYRLVFALLLKPQIADTEVQEQLVRASGLDWVIVQPVNLTDQERVDACFASPEGNRLGMTVSRAQVGRFLAEAAPGSHYLGRAVALSA
jgi:uncharacterized protein YbjT (DUF2867 family)